MKTALHHLYKCDTEHGPVKDKLEYLGWLTLELIGLVPFMVITALVILQFAVGL